MDTNKTLVSHAAKYGIILAAVNIAYSMILYLLEVNIFNIILGLVTMVFMIAFISGVFAVGTKKYRNTAGEGYLPFGRAFFHCLAIGVFAALLMAAYNYLYYEFIIEKETLISMASQTLDKMQEKWQVPQEQLDKAYEGYMEQINKPAYKQGISSFFSLTIFSAIVGLIVAAVVKKKKPLFDTPAE